MKTVKAKDENKMDECLYHFGILGQKWGIRRFQNPDGTLTAEGKRRYGIEGANPSDLSGRKQRLAIRSMSDADLNARLNRMRAEKQFAELSEELYHPGRKAAREIRKKAVERLVVNPVLNIGGRFIEKQLNKGLTEVVSKVTGVKFKKKTKTRREAARNFTETFVGNTYDVVEYDPVSKSWRTYN